MFELGLVYVARSESYVIYFYIDNYYYIGQQIMQTVTVYFSLMNIC